MTYKLRFFVDFCLVASRRSKRFFNKLLVGQLWDAANLKPYRIKTFKISNDPDFAEKLMDIVGLFMAPSMAALVLSVDEQTTIQALNKTLPGLPLSPGHRSSFTHDNKRHGTTSFSAVLNVLPGEVIGKLSDCTRSKAF